MGESTKVYIIILNWNGWKDTIECLESVFRNNYSNYRVVVCDNDSIDGSVQRIKDWAEGGLQAQVDIKNLLNIKFYPPVEKPIPYVEYNREEAESGGDRSIQEPPLILIRNTENLGFAAGNNIGLRYVLTREYFEYAWLLNNDTVIDSLALTEMVRQMNAEPKSGMCGSTLLYYHEPMKIQAVGGATYYKWIGSGRNIGEGLQSDIKVSRAEVLGRLDYVLGASMLVRKSLLQQVGLLSEDYFLFYEEIDWALRAKPYFDLTYAENSIVYHKHGGSTIKKKVLDEIPDYYGIRNRLIFTRKFYAYILPATYATLIIVFLNRLRRRQFNRARWVLRLLIKGK